MGKSVLSHEFGAAQAGRLLASLRKYAGLDQKDVARRARISVDSVSKRETGATEGQWLHPLRHLAVLAQASPQGFDEVFGLLFGGEEAGEFRSWLESARYMWEHREEPEMRDAISAARTVIRMYREIESLKEERGVRRRPKERGSDASAAP